MSSDCSRKSSALGPRVKSFLVKDFALFLCLSLGYFIAAKLGLRAAVFQPHGTPIWIPPGGAIAAFILLGYRVWPAVLILSFLGHVTTLGLVKASFLAPVAATLEGVIGAYLVNKFAGGVKAFDTAKGVLLFVLSASICAPSINAAVAFNSNYFVRRVDFANSAIAMLQWWLAHGIGILVVAPFLILLFRGSHHRMNLPELAELTILLVGLIFVCLLVFGPLSLSLNKSQVIQPWLCVPFLIWAGFRFCPLEAAGTIFILFGSAIWGTVHGYGLFLSKNQDISFALLDTFVGVIGTMTLVVAALVVERRRIEEELLGVQSLLQSSVEGKDQELAVTAQALEVEFACHAQTKRSLCDSQERVRALVENSKFDQKPPEIQIREE